MLSETIPEGATHYEDTYGIITYWKRAIGIRVQTQTLYYNLDNEPYYGWWSYNGKEWQAETYVRSTHFKEIG